MSNTLRMRRHVVLFGAALTLVAGCSSLRQAGESSADRLYPHAEVLDTDEGIASYYHNKFHGRRTASGERYDRTELTAAHRTYPFGTLIRVQSLVNGRAILVRITDRGPWKESRIIDLSYRAARSLEMIRAGLMRVRIDVLAWGCGEES